jgi:hypothetical protein
LGPIDSKILRLRLEEELLALIPHLKDRELIAALRLYHTYSPSTPSASTSPNSKKTIEQLLQEMLPKNDKDAMNTS